MEIVAIDIDRLISTEWSRRVADLRCGSGDKGFVTIQFGGICTLGLFKKGLPKVWLLNSKAIGDDGHRPCLLVPGTEKTSGKHPDSVVMFPEAPFEYGVWKLDDTTIEVSTDVTTLPSDKLTVVNDGSWSSITKMIDVSALTGSRTLESTIESTATLSIGDFGVLRAVDPGEVGQSVKFSFHLNGKERVGPRAYASQFQWLVPAYEKVTITLKKEITNGAGSITVTNDITVEEGTRVVISNACFAEAGTGDYLAHYNVVQGGDRPELQDEVGAASHEDPYDIRCATAFVVVD